MRAHPRRPRRTARVEYTLPPEVSSARWARQLTTGFLTGSRTPAGAARGLEGARLVVSELVTNAVRQGDGQVRVSLEAEDDSVLVEVFDSGHRLPTLSDFPVDATGGRGLHLIDTVCEDWGVREELDGKSVWARLRW